MYWDLQDVYSLYNIVFLLDMFNYGECKTYVVDRWCKTFLYSQKNLSAIDEKTFVLSLLDIICYIICQPQSFVIFVHFSQYICDFVKTLDSKEILIILVKSRFCKIIQKTVAWKCKKTIHICISRQKKQRAGLCRYWWKNWPLGL